MVKYVLKLLVIVGLFFSCSEKGDDQAPEIELDFLFPVSVEKEVCGVIEPSVFVLSDDEAFKLHMRAYDNEALGQLKIDIHANFDCHGHGGLGTIGRPPGQSTTNDWRLLDIRDISGSSWDDTLSLIPPGYSTAGPYHLSFQVLDESGNETEPQFYTIYLYNSLDTVPPEITLNAPAGNDLGSVDKGSEILFEGKITDNRSLLEGGNGIVYLVYQDLNSGNYFQGPYERIQLGDGQSFDFSLEFEIPNSLVSGDYRIFLRGIDGLNNVSEPREFSFSIP